MLVLLAPGFSSSVVGVMAGQAIMQGLYHSVSRFGFAASL